MLHYRKALDEDALKLLGENIAKLIGEINATGNIINNDNIVVNVDPRSAYSDPSIKVQMDIIVEDIYSGDRKPGHVFIENGKTFLIDGPDIDYKKILQQKIKSAKHQSVSNCIFITAINTDLMLGDMSENIRSIESLFQPNRNTRYSSVLLANSQSFTVKKNWTQIRNPYAEVPVTEEILRLFMG